MKKIELIILSFGCFFIACGGGSSDTINDDLVIIEPVLNGGGVTEFTNVQPMTGIVVWDGNANVSSGAHTLEYSYMLYEDIVSEKGVYDWTTIENKLNDIASRNHQAILRFRYAYVGQLTSVPKYIKDLPDYNETEGTSEGKVTWFPDWSHQELQDFTLEFYEKFAEKYDDDNRIAFLQTGFGLWAEYHIYDGPFVLGQTFPSKDYQTTFLNKLNTVFNNLHWSISIDAEDTNVTPLSANTSLLNIPFGVFDDSFMSEEHGAVNEPRFNFFGTERYQTSPIGGEFNYYTTYDQQNVLSPNGPHGESYESFANRFHVTYMIGNDQYQYQTTARIKEASINTGYKFEVTKFEKSNGKSLLTVKNIGTAPIYYDAYLSINDNKSTESLKTVMPDQESVFTINYDGNEDVVIVCDRLLNGQVIDFKKSY
ncbi:hypothetical protein Q4Q35_04115 [Flavivirga aquimarina]|uniref:DUF4832 domain-containing protein n=1 Tax=Flavivirga aquimarina TaxID=2027862 RepID=A0ABT8W776_9FLAO|nr:hypothetical protein [Flavivirga aquimarina]MDO5968984.1 hypothetical protein [Flavivirga aquimarina]